MKWKREKNQTEENIMINFSDWWDEKIGHITTWLPSGQKLMAKEAWEEGARQERLRWITALRKAPSLEIKSCFDQDTTRVIIEKGVQYAIDMVFEEDKKRRKGNKIQK